MNLRDGKLLGVPKKIDLSKALDGPAISANRFFIGTSPNIVRLTFCEQVTDDGDVSFRAALNLDFQIIKELHRQLTLFIDDIEKVVVNSAEAPAKAS